MSIVTYIYSIAGDLKPPFSKKDIVLFLNIAELGIYD